jgi:cysteine desulfurase
MKLMPTPPSDSIYFDHAAATPLDDRVLAAMLPYFADEFYNPSSPYAPAVKVRRAYKEAKADIAKAIGAKPDEIIMTAGASESISLAFHAIKGHVVTSSIEHDAVLNAACQHEHTLVPVNAHGIASAEVIEKAIRPDTELISIALANSELGTIQPIRAIGAMVKTVRERRLAEGNMTALHFHCDASQGMAVLDLHVSRLGVDMLTLNAGKIYGPKQVGLLWASSRAELQPLVFGGGQENGVRSGTENVAGVIGFARAVELATEERDAESARLRDLSEALRAKLREAFPDAVFSGSKKHQLPGFVHVSFPGVDAERLVFALEARGVLVATGSACAANKNTRSHVLVAIGLSDEVADGSLRLTLGHLSTPENVTRGAEILIEEVLRELARTAK